jgi:hypothetical protein
LLHTEMLTDLRRAHPFAAERIGFAFGRVGSLGAENTLILLNRYHTIPDEQYVDDPTVGARIGPEALTWAMQAVYHGRVVREGIFHVHLHEHQGEPGMGATDSREIPRLMPGFRSVGRDAAHGNIILSADHGAGWIWLPSSADVARAKTVSVIGMPVGVFEWSHHSCE